MKFEVGGEVLLGVGARLSAIHVRSVSIMLQLAQLRLVEGELPPRFWTTETAFRSMADVSRYVGEHIRRALDSAPSTIDTDDVWASVRRSEQGLQAIARDPALACFLAAGASVSSIRVRETCRQLAALLGLALAPDYQWSEGVLE